VIDLRNSGRLSPQLQFVRVLPNENMPSVQIAVREVREGMIGIIARHLGIVTICLNSPVLRILRPSKLHFTFTTSVHPPTMRRRHHSRTRGPLICTAKGSVLRVIWKNQYLCMYRGRSRSFSSLAARDADSK